MLQNPGRKSSIQHRCIDLAAFTWTAGIATDDGFHIPNLGRIRCSLFVILIHFCSLLIRNKLNCVGIMRSEDMLFPKIYVMMQSCAKLTFKQTFTWVNAMKTTSAKIGTRRNIGRRKHRLTIHFADRRSGTDRRVGADRRIDVSNYRKNGEEHRMLLDCHGWPCI